MKTSSISVASFAVLLALFLSGRVDGFAPPRIGTSSIVGGRAPSPTSPTEATILRRNNYHATTATKHIQYMSSNDNEIGGTDRVLSCLPYLLPLLDGDRYGRYLFYTIPLLGNIDFLLLGPFKFLYGSVPFAQFAAFIALSVASRNPELPRSVRFNMQQALILDIALIFPSLLGGLGAQLQLPPVLANSGSNFVYLAMVASVGYSLVSNLTGRVPNRIPVISEAADSSVGY